jgi:hypothetical protein
MSSIPEPEQSRPWRPEDGPEPTVTVWPPGERPALEVWCRGKWRYAPVTARQDWPDGTVHYQVSVPLHSDMAVTSCLYQWPQPGLRAVRSGRPGPAAAPESRTAGAGGARPAPAA